MIAYVDWVALEAARHLANTRTLPVSVGVRCGGFESRVGARGVGIENPSLWLEVQPLLSLEKDEASATLGRMVREAVIERGHWWIQVTPWHDNMGREGSKPCSAWDFVKPSFSEAE